MPTASVLSTVLCPLSGIAERIIEEGQRGHMSRVDKNALVVSNAVSVVVCMGPNDVPIASSSAIRPLRSRYLFSYR